MNTELDALIAIHENLQIKDLVQKEFERQILDAISSMSGDNLEILDFSEAQVLLLGLIFIIMVVMFLRGEMKR